MDSARWRHASSPRATRHQLVIIGPEVDLEQACDLAEVARLDRPELGVILLRRRVDVTVLSQALRSGVREVVVADDLRPSSKPAGAAAT